LRLVVYFSELELPSTVQGKIRYEMELLFKPSGFVYDFNAEFCASCPQSISRF
jgi:hypothetical protein